MDNELEQEVSQTIEKMLQDTAERIRQDRTNQGAPRNVAAASLAPVYNYCHAVLLLAKNGQTLPAMALMRVLGEFTIRLMWCYESQEPGCDASTRIDRWYKYSLNERKRAMERWLPVLKESDPEFAKELEATIGETEKTRDSMKCRSAPPLTECVESLGSRAKQLFPLLYTRYAHAVHIDGELLSELHRPSDSDICFSGDGVEVLTPADLGCAALWNTLIVIITIWDYFGWDWSQYQTTINAITDRAYTHENVDRRDPLTVVLGGESAENESETESGKGKAGELSDASEMTDELTAEIAGVFGRMIESTADRLLKEKEEWTPPRNLAAAALTPVYTYCHAVLLLAENEYELPTMALLRVLGEFAMRLVWCYESTENQGDATTRIERWYKYSLNERRKAMEKWLPLLREGHPELVSEVESRIMNTKEIMAAIPHAVAPSLTKCLETHHPAGRLLMLLSYTPYIHSVHMDAVLLNRLTHHSGSNVIYMGDTEELTPLTLKCRSLSIAFSIISTIWSHFGWDWREHMTSLSAIIRKCNLPQEIDLSASYSELFRPRATGQKE